MKRKAGVVQAIAVFRTALFIPHSICSQLACLILALSLLMLPYRGGVRVHQDPTILTPLTADLVPLGTSLEFPPSSTTNLPSFLAPARLVLGPLPAAVIGPNAEGNNQLRSFFCSGFREWRAPDSSNGRSPPSD
jgi:hypothetical protein